MLTGLFYTNRTETLWPVTNSKCGPIVKLPYVVKSPAKMKEARTRFMEMPESLRKDLFDLYTHHEAKRLNHARFGQCPNCGANDWIPTFMLNTDKLYELINYSCAYCGTRKEE